MQTSRGKVDKDTPSSILGNLFALGLQVGAKTKTAKEVGYPIKEALLKLDAHYKTKYSGLIDKKPPKPQADGGGKDGGDERA